MSRWLAAALGVMMVTMGLAGCISSGEETEVASNDLGAPEGVTQIVDDGGQPLAFAQLTQRGPGGDVLAVVSANATGIVTTDQIAPAAETAAVTAPGHETWEGGIAELPAELSLAEAADPLTVDTDVDTLSFLEPVNLGAAYMADRPETCNVNNCGASEPVIEIAADGTIYVSGTCCIGGSPPIWYSTDDGNSFQILRGDVLRDSFGIEGDFAIDDAGNMYFSDISVASAYISSWTADQEHRWTVPAGPFAPIVDRPWIEAGGEDHAWFLYNTGSRTMLYESNDGGLTWAPLQAFGSPLGTFETGTEDGELWVHTGHLFHSEDGGETFEDVGEVPRPSEEGSTFQPFEVIAVDEAGDPWVVYDWSTGDSDAYHVYAVKYADGSWGEPVQVSPEEGTHHLPWASAGAEGTLALAWYGTLDDEAHPNGVAEDAQWQLFSAVTVDGTSEQPSFQLAKADPLPVHEGPMNRQLLDFLQVEIGPQGGIHIAYAQDRHGQVDEVTEYVRTPTGLDLAPDEYEHGP